MKPEKDGVHQIKGPGGMRIEYTVKDGVKQGRWRVWGPEGMLYSQKYFLSDRPVTKKKYLEACATNPKLPRYEDEKITNTLGNYFRRLKREKRQQAKLGPTPEQIQSQKWFDQKCQSEVKKKTSSEALSWLSKKAGGGRELGDMVGSDASKFIRKLYSLGALKIWATDIEKDEDGDQYSKRLILKLPREKERQGKIYEACSEQAIGTRDFGPYVRIGLAYMRASLV